MTQVSQLAAQVGDFGFDLLSRAVVSSLSLWERARVREIVARLRLPLTPALSRREREYGQLDAKILAEAGDERVALMAQLAGRQFALVDLLVELAEPRAAAGSLFDGRGPLGTKRLAAVNTRDRLTGQR